MPTPKPVSKKLDEVLGEEVGGSMSEWLDSLESRTEEMKRELHADIAELRQEVHALREEMRVSFAKVDAKFANIREEMGVGFARFDGKADGGFAELRAEMATLRSDLSSQLANALRWMFGIWIGSFVAIVGLLTFFRGVR